MRGNANTFHVNGYYFTEPIIAGTFQLQLLVFIRDLHVYATVRVGCRILTHVLITEISLRVYYKLFLQIVLLCFPFCFAFVSCRRNIIQIGPKILANMNNDDIVFNQE